MSASIIYPKKNAAAVSQSDLLDLIYPVGSIYMSANAVSPESFLGGTWTQLKDRFLLAAGDSYAAGKTGGAATHAHTTGAHTLTADEMPAHTHSGTTAGGGAHNHTATTSSAGGHNHDLSNHTHSGTTSWNGNHAHSVNALNANVRIDNNYLGWESQSKSGGGSDGTNAYNRRRIWAEVPAHNTNSAGGHNHTMTTGGPSNNYTSRNGDHTHSLTTSRNGDHTHTFGTSSTGGGKAHSHGDTGVASSMPPYLTVYCWQRTA